MRKKQQRLYNKAKHSGNERLWIKFRDFRKQYNKSLRNSHKDYIKTMFTQENENNNKKSFFKYIKNLRKDKCGISSLKTDISIVSDPQGKANILSNYFKSVFTLEPEGCMPPLSHNRLPAIPPLYFSTDGILKLLHQLDPNKASGPDNIPVKILKECNYEIAPILSYLFNQSLLSGTLPSDWRMAFITPLFKKGDRTLPSNYRPISLTSVCCKVMEHIIFKHIITHCENYNVFTDVQHGFRQKRSCESQLLETIDDLAFHMDRGQQIDVVTLDFRKAFDTVPHKRLLAKLAQLGISGPVFQWLSSFLTERHQNVVVDGSVSEAEKVVSGVPQGTVLGPLLFLLYINDLPNLIHSQVRLFADDCLLYRVIKHENDHVILQDDLKQLENWQDKWLMQFNPSKCTIMSVKSSRRKAKLFDYHLCKQKLQRVSSSPYLGVELSENLSWDLHIDKTVKKANSVLGLVRRNLFDTPKTTKILAYNSIVRPGLEYASSVWDPHTVKNINKIEKVQRSGARFVMNDYSRSSSVTSMIESLKWQSLQTRRKCARITNLFKIRNNNLHVKAAEYRLVPARSKRPHSSQYRHLEAKSDIYKYSYFPRTIVDWNSLPPSIVESTTTSNFKIKLQKHSYQ